MAKRIFKHKLSSTNSQTIKLPKGSKVLSVENQFEDIVLYALLDDSKPFTSSVKIEMRGTGHGADGLDSFDFLGTVKLSGGTLMLHVFCNSEEV